MNQKTSGPHHPPVSIGGLTYSLAHLDARVFPCPTPQGKFMLGIRARFSNHCYTEKFNEVAHAGKPIIYDGDRPRVFCPQRQALSLGLPQIIDALPGAEVQQTDATRNYVHFTAVTDPLSIPGAPTAPYAVFFTLKKADKGMRQHLELYVESAYIAEGSTPFSRTVWKGMKTADPA